MGKTVEMLSLILSNPPPAYWETSGGAGKRVGATLVIVPTALLDQWVNEVRTRTTGLTVTEYPKLPPAMARKPEAAAVDGGGGGVGGGTGMKGMKGMKGTAASSMSPKSWKQKGIASFFTQGGGGSSSSSKSRKAVIDTKTKQDIHIVLTTYRHAGEIAQRGIEWWRVVVDEPHSALTAMPRAGHVDVSPEVRGEERRGRNGKRKTEKGGVEKKGWYS